ncbi:MAG: site-2 protease family protein [Nanoarchaeota archaeon]|nr:site-2 protease family protein [Nanoarchaeota archaeon]MBU1644254.1 site-2 protease family protein [Nanoarchaeota archaeon]MBU1977226.1 site-2 protease family protein [Nanoarchaeota archaeon]
MVEILSFLLRYKFIILFYLFVASFLFLKRKKLEVQAKVIFLYRMKWGLKWMDKYAQKFREWIILLGYIGVGAGYVGLVFISYILIKNLYTLIMQPQAVSGVSLVLPGVNVPGLGVLPFWYWLLAIFIIALVHEFSHGIVARAHKIEVKNTGIAFFGPILGAFVEPNEKKLRKESDIKQYSVLAAGAFSNILLGIVALLLLTLAFAPLQESMVISTGFTFDNYVDPSLPFAKAGILPGTLITGIEGKDTVQFQDFAEELSFYRPGDKITIKTVEKEYSLILGKNPDNLEKPYLGIQDIHNEFEVKEKYSRGVWKAVYVSIGWLAGFMRWLFILSLGIGLFNLLPLPIVDGGRMAQVFLHKLKGPVNGEKRYRQISLLFLLILLLNLFYPLLAKLFF